MRAKDIKVTEDVLVRMFGNTAVNPTTGCWEWRGARIKQGSYGRIELNGRLTLVHRIAWCWVHGRVNTPDDKPDLDHLCRNVVCWNPQHLEAVPRQTNVVRGIGPQLTSERSKGKLNGYAVQLKMQTHCKHGHEFTPENTGVQKVTGRYCRECKRAQWRARDKQKREVVHAG